MSNKLTELNGKINHNSNKHILIGKWSSAWNLSDTSKNIGSKKAAIDNEYYKTTTGADSAVTVKKSGLEYLESRTDMNPALFVSLRSPHERLTDKGVEDIVRRTGRRVGVKAYPHKFRGTSITNALNRGMPLQEASCMAGHVKSDTTLRYAQLDQDSVRYHHKKYLSA